MKIFKEKISFTQVSNDVLNDKSLSAKAKGIFAYLYSKPDSWSFSSERIKNDFSDGLKSIKTGLKELENAGYLKRERQGDGKMRYFIGYTPKVENGTLDNEPKSQKGSEPKSLCAKKDQISNIDNINNTELINNTEINSQFESFWNIYPKKVNKKKSEELFKKINKEGSVDLQKIISGLENYKKYIEVKKVEKPYILHPTTFLNGRRWEDDFGVENEKTFEKVGDKNYLEGL